MQDVLLGVWRTEISIYDVRHWGWAVGVQMNVEKISVMAFMKQLLQPR
jgi:hypothetical protein